MKREKLDSLEIEERLAGLNGWKAKDGKLYKRFEFVNFAESLGFVNKIGFLAEAAGHHPDITFGWGYAEFEITTHDRGGITECDFALAGQIDGVTKAI
ncbi:MAG: 4a-hydroxytetrahydrobiopterin dehydratase [Pyrinomonadaceae bacterium]